MVEITQKDLENILGKELSYYQNNSFELVDGNTYYQIIAIEKKYKPDAYQMEIPFKEIK